jgi:fatty acid desaturase
MITVGQEIEGIDLRSLTTVEPIHFQAKLLVMVLVIGVLIWCTLAAPGVLWIVPSLLLGLPFAHGVELQHQCLHNTAYRSRIWNRIAGVLVGLPSLVSFSDYQNSHLKHHRFLGTPEDKEFFNYSYNKLTSVAALIPHLWMVRHYRDVAGYIIKSLGGKLVRENEATLVAAKKIRFEYQLMGLFLGAMAVISIVAQTSLFLKIWLLPFLIAIPAHALIELPEHIGCNVRTPNILENTRTIMAGRLAVWFVDGNNYHVEHHWLPGVPNDKFRLLNKHVLNRVSYVESSYWTFYKKFLKNLRAGKLQQAWNPEPQRKTFAAHS